MKPDELVKVARQFSTRPSDQNWAWLYMLFSGRVIATTIRSGKDG